MNTTSGPLTQVQAQDLAVALTEAAHEAAAAAARMAKILDFGGADEEAIKVAANALDTAATASKILLDAAVVANGLSRDTRLPVGQRPPKEKI